MRRGLKITIIVVASLAFVLSTLFNIFAFKSSYASLMFSYDKEKYKAMASLGYGELSDVIQGLEVNKGLKVKGENIDECHAFEAEYYVESDGSVNVKTVCTIDGHTSTYYYTDSYLYTENEDGKTSTYMTYYSFISTYPSLYKFMNNVDLYDDTVENEKTKVAFSVSPFYLIGIRYEYTKDTIDYKYNYDLKGRLRNVEIADANKTSTLKITYKNSYIAFPDLTEFN